MKKLITLLVLAGFLASSVPVHAMENDWRIWKRNADDTEDVISAVPVRATSSPALLGGFPASNNAVWYYFGPNFTVNTSSNTPYPGAKAEITLDLGGFNPLDLGNLGDLLDAKAASSTVSSLAFTVASHTSTLSGLAAPFSVVTFMANQASTTPYVATASLNGFLSSADKIKLDAISTTTPAVATSTVQSMVAGLYDPIGQATSTRASISATYPLQYNSSTGVISTALSTSTVDRSYEGTVLRTGTIDVYKSATVASGVAVFHITTDGTSGGTAIFPNGIIQDSIDVEVNDAVASYQMSYALSNGNKTITVTANKLTTSNILTGVLGQAQANGSVVRLMVSGY